MCSGGKGVRREDEGARLCREWGRPGSDRGRGMGGKGRDRGRRGSGMHNRADAVMGQLEAAGDDPVLDDTN